MPSELVWGRFLLWATVFVSAGALGLPRWHPLAASAALLVGPGVGLALFAVLAGRPRLPGVRLHVAAVRAGYLTVAAAFEEVLWRGLGLGVLGPRIGVGAALAVTSVAFAVFHAHIPWPSRGLHILTGFGFGTAFLCGGLVAAIAAHAVYNVLVDLGVQAERRRHGGGR